MAETMIERVAKALVRHNGQDPDENFSHGMDWPKPRWQLEVGKVRTVIAAMREPLNGIVIAGGMAVAPNIVDCPDDAPDVEVQMRDHQLGEARTTWRAMIDAVLAEEG